MANKEGDGKSAAAGPGCGCLPEVMPEGVQRSLEGLGGLDGLLSLIPDQKEVEREVGVHKAMGDALRLRVLHLLSLSPFCVCVLRAVTGVEDSKLSYHLGILRSQGLISSERDGSFVIYSITDEGRARLEACDRSGGGAGQAAKG